MAHPEIELFVQSLLMSRQVGGRLSTTLERLANQVRKRQQFKGQAMAAVALEKNSTYVIGLMMFGLLVFLYFTTPKLILASMETPIGKQMVGWSILLIFCGFMFIKKVTNIKI